MIPTETIDWTSTQQVQAAITNALAVAVSVLAVVHPGFSLPTWVQGTIPVLAVAVAAFVHRFIIRRAAAKVTVETLSAVRSGEMIP